MTDITQKLQILVRIEKMRLRLAGRAFLGNVAMMLVAGILAIGGLAMFSFALFLVISNQYGILVGALATGGVLFVIAFLLLFFAKRLGKSSENRTVDELEKLILGEIKADLGQGQLPLKVIEQGAQALLSKSGGLASLITAVLAFFSVFLKSRK